jgi:hypothetical protein
MLAAALALLLLADPEVLKGGAYRAVTIKAGDRKLFKIPDLEKLTGSSGKCIEEGMADTDEGIIAVSAECAGVRTTMAWLNDKRRVTLLVCAEKETTPALEKQRSAIAKELRDIGSVTVCIREKTLWLHGWVFTDAQQARVRAIAGKNELIENRVERPEGD